MPTTSPSSVSAPIFRLSSASGPALPISDDRLVVPRYAATGSPLIVLTTLTETDRTSYLHRVAAYRRFYAAMMRVGVPLYTFEVVRPGTPFVTQDDGTTIRCRRPAAPRLWQKEYMLNYLLERTPPHYDMVAWIDADVVYDNDSWAAAVVDLLEQCAVAQLFDHLHWLYEDESTEYTFVSCLAKKSGYAPAYGLAWGARRELLEATGGLYYRAGSGANDGIMAAAFTGETTENFAGGMSHSAKQWIRQAKIAAAGRATYLRGHACRHLWHGSIGDRRYGQWDRDLIAAGYDADRDCVPAGYVLETPRTDLWPVLRRHGCV